jgi:3-hydroxyacyl-[acyl-carrier-protein] dehydratase
MLLKDFYKVITLDEKEGQNYLATIFINEKHAVFKGHFPDNPIMPGVCMMQIIKELTEQITGNLLIMQSTTNVKFMALINPLITPELRLELSIVTNQEGIVKVKNATYFGETVALKLSSVYKVLG